MAGFLGPHTAAEWGAMAHGEVAIACHTSIPPGNEEKWVDGMLQCGGAAIYRANVVKSPRDPDVAVGPVDTEKVFDSLLQFLEHHGSSKEEFLEAMYP